jgi:hypothetical protein
LWILLKEIHELIGVECSTSNKELNGENSINPNLNYKNLNIVYLILEKKNG